MSSPFLLRLTRFFVLSFLQVIVFNHIHLFGYVTPLVIGYMVVCIHRETSRTSMLLWGFFTGLVFDLFCNTAGMASASCTLAAMIQPKLLNMFRPHDAAENFTPSITTLGLGRYTLYAFMLLLILHAAFYLLDACTLADWYLTLLAMGSGAALSTIITIGMELLVRTNNKKELHP
ncbi:MAG: rod shape-determining protein MreD [Bacteroidaceae bacterium]|nr:rod shape-determining protein MreD [Bacteroidaceae bacterium]